MIPTKNNMNKSNPVWNFFASVKLALFTLFLLSVTSIIGTVIPQKESAQWYVEKYGQELANFFEILSITPDMYSSGWFLFLLGLLCVNLIVCSFDRFPAVWQLIRADNLDTPLARLEKTTPQHRWRLPIPAQDAADSLTATLNTGGWKAHRRAKDQGILLFAQKGAMTRTGVYIVHASILVIFAGAIIGSLLGFKASIMLPETQSSDTVFAFGTRAPIDLGFAVRCDHFTIEFYDNGMPKAYRSQLSILEGGQVVEKKTIVVNDPLVYKGITFYQSSYEPYPNFLVTITNKKTGLVETAILPFQQQHTFKRSGIQAGIVTAEARGQSVSRMKIWFTDDHSSEPSLFWLDNEEQATVQRAENDYTIHAKQMYATGLQVAKDPGVWTVYLGFGLMLLGLMVAFFMSHQRIWLHVGQEADGTCSILMAGNANKNKTGFARTFQRMHETLTRV